MPFSPAVLARHMPARRSDLRVFWGSVPGRLIVGVNTGSGTHRDGEAYEDLALVLYLDADGMTVMARYDYMEDCSECWPGSYDLISEARDTWEYALAQDLFDLEEAVRDQNAAIRAAQAYLYPF